MFKVRGRITLYLSLVLVGLAGLWFWSGQPWLVHAKITSGATSPDDSTIIPARPRAAGFNISVDQVVASGLASPVQVTHAGDGSGRLFVVEQAGRIKIISNGAVLATPFLDITGIVQDGGEQGLLGLAFHPNYETNGYFYVYYVNNSSNIVIARYSVSANPNVADSGATVLLTIAHPGQTNHNGGQLFFGPLDGYLYIGTGDGGSGGDPPNNAQNKGKLLGKILRIDVNGGAGNAPDGCSLGGAGYTSPTGSGGNPFADGSGGNCDEIWALGLRNPWRFSFDRLNGDLYLGDVGQGDWEEISYQAAATPSGVNFGWRLMEGTHCYNPSTNCNPGGLTLPIVEYDHNSDSFAVTGGYVYRGSQYSALTGYYFYADFYSGRIWSMTKNGPNWSTPEEELDTSLQISAFGEDEQGEMYVVDYSGSIRRLADANGPTPNLSTSTKKISTPHANPGEVVTYTIRLNNTGGLSAQTVFLTDTIPTGLTYVSGSFSATSGNPTASVPTLHWQGTLSPAKTITLTYRVTVNAGVTGSLVNQAKLTGAAIPPLTLTQAIFVPRPVLTTTVKDFFFPGTQPNQLTETIADPGGCDFCHTEPIYDRWRGSMMSQAGRDPLLWAALAVANSDASNAGEYCLRCHTPKGWLEGRSQPDGAALQSDDLHAGVACEVCHRLVNPVVASPADETTSIDAAIRASLTSTLPSGHSGSAMMIVDPQDQRRGPFSLTAPHSAFKSNFLGQGGNPVTESRLCGTCHNVDNPVLSWDGSRYWPNGNDLAAPSFNNGDLFPIERTYDEWLNSTYATTGVYAPQFAGAKPDGIVRSCQDCHMRRLTGTAAEAQYNPVNRNCTTTGCLPGHDLVGGNTWAPLLLQDSRWRLNSNGEAAYLNNTILRARDMLQNAATLTVTLTGGPTKNAIVRVTNQTGHKLPTGYPEGRRIWLNLKAYDANNQLIYESGAYNPTSGLLTQDAAVKIYETKHGLSADLAAQASLPAGESFHFVLNNTIIKDNRIPPRGFSAAALSQRGLSPVQATYAPGQYWDDTIYPVPANTDWVVATLYYQTSSKEYIDFLRNNGGVDGATLGQLWDTTKSPPEVMAIASSDPIYLPLIFK